MQGRALTSLVVVLLLTTGLAMADGLARLGTPTTVDVTVADAPSRVESPTIALPLDPPAPAARVWVDAEALLWWMKAANLPPLVTASPPEHHGTLLASWALLGQASCSAAHR